MGIFYKENIQVPFTLNSVAPSLAEIGLVVLEKKVLKSRQHMSVISL